MSNKVRNNVVLIAIAIFIGQFVRQNPFILGRSVGADDLPSSEAFPVYTSDPVLDAVLQHHRNKIGADDYDKYRNHCLRVLSFAGYYYDTYGEPFLHEQVLNVMALALAYHDIGLWTAGALDYLAPSVATMEQDWENEGFAETLPATFDDDDLVTARTIIMLHHKYTEWRPPPKQSTVKINVVAVNAVRRADWADATMGIVRTGLPAAYLEQAYNVVPEAGFHAMLGAMGGRLSPDSLLGQLDEIKILKW